METRIRHRLKTLSVLLLFIVCPYIVWGKTGLQTEEIGLKEALQRLTEKYNVYFTYDKSLIKDIKVDYSENGKDITEELYKLLNGTDLRFKIFEDQFVIIYKLDQKGINSLKSMVEHFNEIIAKDAFRGSLRVVPMLRLKDAWSPPPRKLTGMALTVKGIVTDQQGEALIGVNVQVKGTNKGTATDFDGNYSLEDVNENATLVFSYIGYQTVEVPVDGRTEVSVELVSDSELLDEVVVVGYGTQKKSDLTGAVSSVAAEDLQQTPITSIDQGLVGRAAGVLVTQTSGMPGAVASIRVRGSSSLQGGNEPLYVIDGFPVYSGGGFGNTGGNARLSGLATINPSDIESIEVLKDASATAIYGARAANGVVLITTKSGKRGRDQISFDANYGVQKVVRKIDVMNALEYANLVNEAYTNDGLAPFYDDNEMNEIRNNPEGTNWQDQIFRTAPTQQYQLTFSGGDEKLIYSISANYSDQEGIIRSSDFKRYSGRINLSRNISQDFKIGANLTISKTVSNAIRTDAGGNQGVVSAALKFNPILPVFQNKELGIYTPVNSPGVVYPNPVATADEQVRETQRLRLLNNVYGEWEFLPNFKAKVSVGLDLVNNKSDTYIPSNIHESGGVAKATIGTGFTTNWLNENTISWSKQLNTDHFLSLLGGITFQQNQFEGVIANSQEFVNDILEENALGSASVYTSPSSSYTEWSLLSYLGRANYNFRERYLISLNGRIDGSSRFGENNKYAFFPSASLAWRVIEENFMGGSDFFSDLKLRTSYGFTGNQEFGLYNSLPTLGSNSYTIGRTLVTGFFPNKIPNPDLKWEKTGQFNLGVDMGFWNNRMRVTSDYYIKKTTDLIYSVAIPFASGFGTSIQNLGSVENRGWELAIESDLIANRDFSWSVSFNTSFNKNEILELGGEDYKDVGDGDGHLKTGSVHRLIVGKPIGLFYGYVSDGIFQDEAELSNGPKGPTNWVGAKRYKDISGPDGVPDGKVDATYDRAVIGDPNPDFFGGLTNMLNYKGIELNVFLQYSIGNDILNYNSMDSGLPSGGQNVYQELVNRWTTTNTSNVYPKATTNRSNVFSDSFIEDGSYLKIKTLTLGYSFPGVRNNALKGLKLYITGQNLLAFTQYSGYDPEVSYRGASNLQLGEDFGGYPQARTFLFGLKLNL